MDTLELLGSKARLELLRALSQRDMYVSEVIDEVGIDGKTATHHLDGLTDASILESYTQGRRRYYLDSARESRPSREGRAFRRPVGTED